MRQKRAFVVRCCRVVDLVYFRLDNLYEPHLADVLQVHGVYNHLIIIRNKLFVDRMMEWPRLQKEERLKIKYMSTLMCCIGN